MCRTIVTVIGAIALSVGAGGCGRGADQPDAAVAGPEVRESDRAAEFQRQREQELSTLDDRVAAIGRRYEEKGASLPRRTASKTAASRLHEAVQHDLDDVRHAVDDLRATTADNWWERHESALKTAADDVESDVKRFSGTKSLPNPRKDLKVADPSGQSVSTAPFTSSRDRFVSEMHTRLDAMNRALDRVKATGPRKTELDDLHARATKLAADVDRLKTASAEDWWDLSRSRVSDYLDRVERSVARLDDRNR